MLIDARTIPKNRIIETDVCIVGAGAAGITLAREFIDQPFKVCLLESGGFEADEQTQDLYKGRSLGIFLVLEGVRLRYFGGTTNHWGNYCAPLDEIDFETRDWIPNSGWPFRKSHLDPFYQRAQSICQLGPFAYEAEAWETKSEPRLPFIGDRVMTSIFQQHLPPLRFGKIYRDEIVKAHNITTFLYANLVNIETTDTARNVTRLRIGCLQGNNFWVKAKLFILASGAIENARLLLLSNDVQSTGLGNQNDLVGRFFMSHTSVDAGLFLPSDPFIPVGLYLYHKPVIDSLKIIGHLSLSSDTQRYEKLLNFNAVLIPISAGKKGLPSLRRLVKGEFDSWFRDLGNVIAEIDGVATAVFGKLLKGVVPIKAFDLRCAIEQSPNPNSRVTLSSERDALGKNRTQLDWRLSTIDKRSLIRSLMVIGEEFGRAGLGRLKITLDNDDSSWPEVSGGVHHMGTTRMHVDPKQGVVDENCRVHGISNLFVAGSSVFPTVGHANPTLTISALAIRLADHVKGIMG